VNAKTAPVAAVSETLIGAFGDVSIAAHNSSHNDEAAPQSASISTSNAHWLSIVL
jgi:hypothetical protein